MTNVKSMLSCIGVSTSGEVTVLRNLFGFIRGRVPTDPDTSVTAQVSLLQQAQRLQGDHLHLNVIQVGFDLVADLDDAWEKLDYATYRVRNIYRQVGLGVGRVEHYEIPSADAGGADDLGSEDEADELSDDWSVDNGGIDVFVVRNISDSKFIGISPVGGSCDKPANDDGLIGGEINRGYEGFSRTFAHEIGHFLSLEHNHGDDCPSSTAGQNNLMAQTRCAISTRDSVLLTSGQGSDMRDHCSVRGGC